MSAHKHEERPWDMQAEQEELAAIAVEAMGWLPLRTTVEGGQGEEGESAYLHVGDLSAMVVTVTGLPDVTMAGVNVLWVGW